MEKEFFRSKKGICCVDENGQFWPYVGGYDFSDAINGRVPISSRAKINIDAGGTFQLGDILVRPTVGLPMVLTNTGRFDFGSGYGGVVMFDGARYEKIGSIYEDISPLLPFLVSRKEEFDFEFYGINRPLQN